MSLSEFVTATVAPSRRVPKSTPWDLRVSSWDQISSRDVFERLRDRTLERAALSPNDVVVDLGAGTGLLALSAAQQAREVTALDYSAPMLERLSARARERGLHNVLPALADLREIPLPDDHADVVVSSYAFHHLPGADKELALAEARRILRPGGRLVVCDMMFGITLGVDDRRIVIDKVRSVARKGPGGLVRLARNAARIVAGRWEYPVPVHGWRTLLEARRFAEIDVQLVEAEAGIAFARRPQDG